MKNSTVGFRLYFCSCWHVNFPIKPYFEMHNITLAISHDQFMAFVIAMTDRQIDLRFLKHSGWDEHHWINYLAGAAIIVDEFDNVTYVPVKSLNSGRLGENNSNWR